MAKNLSRRVYQFLDGAPSGGRPARLFTAFMTALILANVLAVALETVEEFHSVYAGWFWGFEVFSVIVFTVEYVLRLWACPSSPDGRFRGAVLGRVRYALTPLALVDLASILPFYLPMLLTVDLRFVRVIRLVRILRVFKLGRYSRAFRILADVAKAKKEELAVTLFILAIAMLVSASMMYYAEHEAQPKVFSSIPASLWWAVVTLATVGYGDVYPITVIGKVIGGVIAVVGIGMFALPTGVLASGFIEALQKNRDHGAAVCPHCGKPINAPPGTPAEQDQEGES